MPKSKGFINRPRATGTTRPVAQRLRDYNNVYLPPTEEHMLSQAERCMDCGVPFCHAAGCPLGNVIPEFNAHVAAGRWREACDLLHAKCSFPEFTGRLCPALCEAACTMSVHFEPVTIREIEQEVCERGWREGYIAPRPPKQRTGRRVAVIGSGPAIRSSCMNRRIASAASCVTACPTSNSKNG
jgi:glutamate synthase (NADPH/NADH) small chain